MVENKDFTMAFKIQRACSPRDQGRRDLEAKKALPQGPPKNRGPRNFVISVKFSIRLLKAREESKPNKVIEKSVLIE